jgi:hypothetical protein
MTVIASGCRHRRHYQLVVHTHGHDRKSNGLPVEGHSDYGDTLSVMACSTKLIGTTQPAVPEAW